MTQPTQSGNSLPAKTNPKTAGHWLSGLLKLFPPTPEVTKERLEAMVLIFSSYPESTLKEICSPMTGMATSFEFLPSLFKFKEYCDKRAAEAIEHDRRVREAIKPQPAKTSPAPSKRFTGPMEDIRPGDILPLDRIDEYREFMRKRHGINVGRCLGFFEEWKDSGARPFQLSAKQEAEENKPNPFDQP